MDSLTASVCAGAAYKRKPTSDAQLISSVPLTTGGMTDLTGNSTYVSTVPTTVDYVTINKLASEYVYTDLLHGITDVDKKGTVEIDVYFLSFTYNSHIFKLGNSLGIVVSTAGELGIVDQDGYTFLNPQGYYFSLNTWYTVKLEFSSTNFNAYVDGTLRGSLVSTWTWQEGVQSYGGLLLGQEPDSYQPYGGFSDAQVIDARLRDLKVYSGTGQSVPSLIFHLDGHSNIGTTSGSVTVTDVNNDVGTIAAAPTGITTTTNDFSSSGINATLLASSTLLSSFTVGGEPWSVSAHTYMTGVPDTSALFGINLTASGANTAVMLFGYGTGVKILGTNGPDLLVISDWSPYQQVWTKWNFVYDGTNIYSYINNVLQTTTAYASPAYNLSSLMVGNESDSLPLGGSGNTFPGYISDFKLYDIAITI